MCHHWVVPDESFAGKLLVSTPRLEDPNFYRTVVLMLQHDSDGTLGVVLNRPTDERVADHLPDWAGAAADPGLVHIGGPVEPAVAIGLAITTEGESTGVPGLCLVDLSAPPKPPAPKARVYSGYAGWGAGQLEMELDEGSWYVVQASPDDPFDDAAGQWAKVLRRQPGLLALVATFPEDVSLN